MKISIITVVYNNAHVIKSAVDSVLNQTYKNIEYIIIDGQSTDGTVEIIQSYGDKINMFISEPDCGIYDAMNKGIRLATGDVVGILNSDDWYIANDVIENMIKIFEHKKVECVFADLVYVRPENLKKVVRYYDSSYFSPNKFAYGLMPAHPTFFCKRELYEIYGYFRTDYKIAADFELLVRFLATHHVQYFYFQHPIVAMRLGGVSTSLKSLYINSREQLRACKDNGIPTNILKILSRYPKKLVGFIKK